mmetsp:Transcript_116024/g.374779  ORF Transcript_116024/g.374779 Transcript_116024/m.374779 type:complete len:209 (-) Transcript_116024:170-796(-)
MLPVSLAPVSSACLGVVPTTGRRRIGRIGLVLVLVHERQLKHRDLLRVGHGPRRLLLLLARELDEVLEGVDDRVDVPPRGPDRGRAHQPLLNPRQQQALDILLVECSLQTLVLRLGGVGVVCLILQPHRRAEGVLAQLLDRSQAVLLSQERVGFGVGDVHARVVQLHPDRLEGPLAKEQGGQEALQVGGVVGLQRGLEVLPVPNRGLL